jgi:MYXO-CTERM domain-containing protein
VYLVWASAGDTIRGGILADNASSLTKALPLATGAGNRSAPSIALTSSPTGAVAVLISWIDRNPIGVQSLRTNVNLEPFPGEPVSLTNGATFEVDSPPDLPPAGFSGADQAGVPRATPAVAVAAMPGGQGLVAYNLLKDIGNRSYSRVHFRALGLRPLGSPCTAATGCSDGICTGGVCCNTPCDGICRACSADGCVVTPPSDGRCGENGVISCSSLSTTCRTYQDQPMSRCAAFGQCAESGSLAECVTFTDVPDDTACDAPCAAVLGPAVCRAGACVCPSEVLIGMEPRSIPPPDCSMGGGGPGGALPLLLLLALAFARRWVSRRRT